MPGGLPCSLQKVTRRFVGAQGMCGKGGRQKVNVKLSPRHVWRGPEPQPRQPCPICPYAIIRERALEL